MKNNFLKVVAINVSFVVAFSGCASIVGGKYETVRIETNPPGATVKTDREETKGITPTDFTLKRKNEHYLTIEKEGYLPKRVTVDTELRGWFWMNLLSWGLIGMVVDMATGSANNLDPKTIVVNLEKA